MVRCRTGKQTAGTYARSPCLLCQIILVGQWASEYLRLYPSANILVTTEEELWNRKPKKVLFGRIATGDYDAVIIGHSQFEKIQMSVGKAEGAASEKQLDDIERGIEDVQKSNGEQFTVKQFMKTRKGHREEAQKTQRHQTVRIRLSTLNS